MISSEFTLILLSTYFILIVAKDNIPPKNIALTPKISNFSFSCYTQYKEILTNDTRKIYYGDRIKDSYENQYNSVGDDVFYKNRAETYTHDVYFDCVSGFDEKCSRAAFALLTDFKCNAKQTIKEGDQIGLEMFIKFTHFSPTVICDESLQLEGTTPTYDNLNSQEAILRGRIQTKVTSTATRSMQGKQIKCRLDYNPDSDLLPMEAGHLSGLPGNCKSLKIDTNQPQLINSEFMCKKNMDVEYLDRSVKIKIDEARAVCEYDSRPKPTNITFVIRYSNKSQIVIKSLSNEINFEKYLDSPITISCTISVTFYDGATEKKSSSFSEIIRIVERTSIGDILESSTMLSTAILGHESTGGLSASSQIGIAVGITMAVLAILVVIIVIICRRKEKDKNRGMTKDIGSEKVVQDLKPQKAITNNSDRVVCADEDGSAVIVDTKANSRKPLYPLDNVNISTGNDGIASSIYSEIRPHFYGYEEPASGNSVIYSNVDKTTPPPPYKIPYSLA